MSSQSLNKNIGLSLSAKQAELYNSDARFKVGMLGRRFGKNEFATVEIIDYAIKPDKYDFGADDNPVLWWVGGTYTQTKKYGFDKILSKLPKPLIKGDPKRSAPFEIELKNGSVIEFYSYDRPASLQGAGVDFMVIDEAAYMDESIWDNDLRPMLLDNNGGGVFISKPLGENWFYELYEQGNDDEFDEWVSIHGTSYDNPWLDNDEIEQIKETTPDSVFQQQYLANPNAGGTILNLDTISYIDAQEVEEKTDRDFNYIVAVDVGITMDEKKARENDSDWWAAAVVLDHPMKPKAYVSEIRRVRGKGPEKAADWIKEDIMSALPTNRLYVEGVQAQRWWQNDLKEVGLNPVLITHDRPKEERIQYLSVPFSNGSVKLIDWENTEYEYDWTIFRKEWSSFPNGAHDDQLDALEMALRQISFNDGMGIVGGSYHDNEGWFDG